MRNNKHPDSRIKSENRVSDVECWQTTDSSWPCIMWPRPSGQRWQN